MINDLTTLGDPGVYPATTVSSPLHSQHSDSAQKTIGREKSRLQIYIFYPELIDFSPLLEMKYLERKQTKIII